MLKKSRFSFFIVLTILLFGISFPSSEESFGNILLHHVTNDKSEVYIPIEIGGLDLSITKHVILLWVVSALVIILGILGTSRYRRNDNAFPTKFSSLFETRVYKFNNN